MATLVYATRPLQVLVEFSHLRNPGDRLALCEYNLRTKKTRLKMHSVGHNGAKHDVDL
jgi:hypothetical protein